MSDEIDLVDVLAKRGGKGLVDVLRKSGFVDQSTADQMIDQRAREISTEQHLRKDYPELENRDSQLFKSAAPRFHELVGQGVPRAAAMRLAVEQAELDGYRSGKRRTATQKEEREQPPRRAEEDENLDDFQKYVCEALEVDPDAYKKRARR